MKKIYKLLLIIGLIAVFFLILMETNWFVPKIKEPENIWEAKELIVKSVAESGLGTDTIYLNQSRLIGVCGNDARFRHFSKVIDKFTEIKNKLENPYIFEKDYGYKDQYQINDQTIIMGENAWFKVLEIDRMFKTPRTIPEDKILDIVIFSVEKDLIKVGIEKNLESKMILQFDLKKDPSSNWKVENLIKNF